LSEATLIRSNAAIIRDGLERSRAGERVALATVALTWGSSPRPAGSVMIITDSGYSSGSVSGGCIEEELFGLVKNDFPSDCRLIEYDAETTKTLPCGGRLQLIVEPIEGLENPHELVDELSAGKPLERIISIKDNSSRWTIEIGRAQSSISDDFFVIHYDSAWKVLIVGFSDLGRHVSMFAQMLDYKVSVCEPRKEFRHMDSIVSLSISDSYPDDFIREGGCDDQTAVLALTHDPKVDDLAVIEAIETSAFYIGALGSKRTAKKREQRLVEHFGFTDEQLSRVKGPIGLDLRTRKVNEIALAVMADVTACRNNVEVGTQRL